jgi:hypothetical protein
MSPIIPALLLLSGFAFVVVFFLAVEMITSIREEKKL